MMVQCTNLSVYVSVETTMGWYTHSSVMHSFLRHERVVLNVQSSNWSHIKAGVPQGSVNRMLLFLVYINDLPEVLTTNAKPFADDASLFSGVLHSAAPSATFNYDLLKISWWVYQLKMIFFPDATKQAQEIIFSHKASATITELIILTMHQ